MTTTQYKTRTLMGVIGDEDTITGLLLAGVGNVDSSRKSNFLVVNSHTTVQQIEESFHDLTTRKDIAVVLITQSVAEEIRDLLDAYTKPIPSVLEIPSKEQPYDPAKDSILKRAQVIPPSPFPFPFPFIPFPLPSTFPPPPFSSSAMAVSLDWIRLDS